jgi:CheY-like chemotaxis protein
MGKRVLVADDSATIQKAFSMVLGGQDGISLVPARSFDEAVTAARQGRPDLVIADIALGNRTGYELCSALKSDPALRGLPVYILGSSQTPYDEARGRQAGADGHLTKPFESQSLIDRVQEALSRPAVAAAPVARPSSPPVAAAAPPVGARPAMAAVVDDLDDEYGEFTIERSSAGQNLPSAPAVASAPVLSAAPPAAPPPGRPAASPGPSPISPFAPATAAPQAASAGSSAALRPSLIPGARPGPAPRPQVSVASASVAPPTAAAQRPAAPPALPRREMPGDPGFHPKRAEPLDGPMASAAAAHAGIGRTIMGLPAVAIPGMPLTPREARPVVPPHTPAPPALVPQAPAVAPMPPPTPAITPIAPGRQPAGAYPLTPVAPGDSAAAVAARIDQKVAAIAARGPEFEAIAKLSREIIEQVVWEVVPELAEAIIREHVERLANARK